LRLVARTLASSGNAVYGAATSAALADENRFSSYLAMNGQTYAFRLLGSILDFSQEVQAQIYPFPSGNDTIAYEYITSHSVVEDDNLTTKAEYILDTDRSLIAERLVRMGLKWRIKHAKGLDYSEDFNRYEFARKLTYSQAQNLGDIPVAVRANSLNGLIVPTEDFG